MSNASSFLQLLTNANNQNVIAFDEQQTFTLKDLQQKASAIREKILSTKIQRWVLAIEDVVSFAAGFLAVASIKGTIILPPNLKQGAIEDICSGDENILTDKVYNNTKVNAFYLPDIVGHSSKQQISGLTSVACQIEMFTSGSSGEPKKITKSLQNLEAELKVLEKNWGNTADNCVFFSTVTHLHIYGLLFRLLWPLTTNRPFFNRNYLFPEDLNKAMKKYPSIILISSPAHLKRIPQMVSLPEFCQPLKLIVSSGGPLPLETAAIFTKEAGQTPLEVFGSTETGGIAWRFQISQNTPWQAFEGVAIQQDKETGTLTLQSPFISDNGWFQTSDLIEIISQNSFHLKGRADRIVKIEEKRIGLAHLESKILETGYITEAYAAVLTPEEQNGRVSLGCLITLNEKGLELLYQSSWKHIIETLRQKLSQFFDEILVPRQWRLLQEIPLNLQGKKVASELKKFFTPVPAKQPFVMQTEKNENNLNIQLYIPADLFYFQGHFDAFPIIPGVAQIHWAVDFTRRYFEIPGKFYQMTNIKFKRVIRPGTILFLNLQRDPVKNTVTFSFDNSADKFSSGVIKFRTTEGANA